MANGLPDYIEDTDILFWDQETLIESAKLDITDHDSPKSNGITFCNDAQELLITFKADGSVEKGPGWTSTDDIAKQVLTALNWWGRANHNEMKQQIIELEEKNAALKYDIVAICKDKECLVDKVCFLEEKVASADYDISSYKNEVEILEEENYMLEAELTFIMDRNIEMGNNILQLEKDHTKYNTTAADHRVLGPSIINMVSK